MRTGTTSLDGGTGVDQASWYNDGGTGGVTVDLGNNTATRGGETDTLVSIENATATNYPDTLYGNAASNDLRGEGGDDWLYGALGRDTLYGGDNSIFNSLFGDNAWLAGGTGGDDRLFGDAGSDFLYGDAYGMLGNALGGNDKLDGGGDRNSVYGDAFEMTGSAGGFGSRTSSGVGTTTYRTSSSVMLTICPMPPGGRRSPLRRGRH